MNKLILNQPGGHPLTLDDLDFMQESVRDSFYAFLGAFGISNSNYIISGCLITETPAGADTTIAVTAGYISLNGEILKVDAHSITRPAGQIAYWVLDSTWDSRDPVAYFDGSSRNVLQVRKGKLAVSAAPPAGYMIYSTGTLKALILDIKANKIQEGWHYVGDSATGLGTTFLSGWSNTYSDKGRLAFYKDDLGIVHIKGILSNAGLTGGGQIFELPAGYIPPTIRRFRVGRGSDSSAPGGNFTCEIVVDGVNALIGTNEPGMVSVIPTEQEGDGSSYDITSLAFEIQFNTTGD